MAPTSDMKMVISSINDIFESNCNSCNEVRGHSLVSSIYSLRTSFMFSSECNEDYFTRAQCKSDNMVEDDHIIPSDSP